MKVLLYILLSHGVSVEPKFSHCDYNKADQLKEIGCHLCQRVRDLEDIERAWRKINGCL